MDTTNLLLSLLFGTVGFGYIMFARKAGLMLPAAAGVVLMVVPYFFTSNWMMSLVCLLVMAAPFFIRDV
jgi:hypothetical protein